MIERSKPTAQPFASTREREWEDSGFDAELAADCLHRGWALADVEEVLNTDVVAEFPLDWCTSGLDPMEALAAIADGAQCPAPMSATALRRHAPPRAVADQHVKDRNR